jgi:hypothetical protein
VNMFTRHPQFSQLPLAMLPIVLPRIDVTTGQAKFVIMLQYIYPKSSTHQTATSLRKTPTEELCEDTLF